MDSADTLRELEQSFIDAKQTASENAGTQAALDHDRRVSEAVGRHFDHAQMLVLLGAMRHAAETGEHRYLALRFPSEVCADGGRGINSSRPDWGDSLRGEAADIFRFWQSDLRPLGFHLSAEVLNFPGGKPGDVGLTVSWG